MANASFSDYNCTSAQLPRQEICIANFIPYTAIQKYAVESQTKSVIFVVFRPSKLEFHCGLVTAGDTPERFEAFCWSNFGTVPPRIICNRYKDPSIYDPPSKPTQIRPFYFCKYHASFQSWIVLTIIANFDHFCKIDQFYILLKSTPRRNFLFSNNIFLCLFNRYFSWQFNIFFIIHRYESLFHQKRILFHYLEGIIHAWFVNVSNNFAGQNR